MGTFRGVELDTLMLDGPRLRLRPWRAADAERVHDVMQDPTMSQFLAEGTGLGAAMVDSATDRVVGSCALRLTGDPEIGYWVAPDARGRGYAAEATRLLAGWGFGVGLPRVRVACDVRNTASARTALAAGFRFEGIGRDGVTAGGLGGVPERRGDLARFARLAGDPDAPVPPVFAPLPADGLGDGVLSLRTATSDDAVGLVETHDELTRAWGFDGADLTPEQVRQATSRAGLEWLVGRTAIMSMIDAGTGSYAGQLVVRLAGPPRIGGIGYAVHPAFRGRGYTTRALRLIVPWAFGAAGFARLELGAKQGNIASQRAAVVAGFTPEGVFAGRLRAADGTFHDEARFALVNPKPAT